ncbi:MAG TPA: dihydrodipicolinate reductase C-terminal domain-containing protein, partial [Bryobacteraceae bacterium]|nr:dihydrodipicolinate reductase C-terminal domain-containing protein [Bryobacteraceae bacterium]
TSGRVSCGSMTKLPSTLRHTARSREGFARGALFAAKWLEGRRGVYDFREALFGGAGEEAR